jgi:hypothetical protein
MPTASRSLHVGPASDLEAGLSHARGVKKPEELPRLASRRVPRGSRDRPLQRSRAHPGNGKRTGTPTACSAQYFPRGIDPARTRPDTCLDSTEAK